MHWHMFEDAEDRQEDLQGCWFCCSEVVRMYLLRFGHLDVIGSVLERELGAKEPEPLRAMRGIIVVTT